MRGNQDEQEEVFSYTPLEQRVPRDHPLRRVRAMTDRALQELSPWFDQLYGQTGRSSIPPEQLLRAQILQAVHHPQPAAVDGSDRRQLELSLVCGFESGRRGVGCDSVHQES